MPPSTIPPHEVLVVPRPGQPGADELRQQCFDIRIAVFHHEQGFPLDTEIDDKEDVSTHFLLRLTPSGTPIGTIRAVPSADGSYSKLTRLALAPDYRKFGFGRLLVQTLHDWARAQATAEGRPEALVVAHSQMHAIPFYAKLGYEPEGEVFDEEGAPHQRMVLRISLS